nr:uncharacterized protein LOC109151331 [Ipomoea trifida]
MRRYVVSRKEVVCLGLDKIHNTTSPRWRDRGSRDIYGKSSSHAAYGERVVKQLRKQDNKEIIEQNKKIMEMMQRLYSAHPEWFQSVDPIADSNQSSGVG